MNRAQRAARQAVVRDPAHGEYRRKRDVIGDAVELVVDWLLHWWFYRGRAERPAVTGPRGRHRRRAG